MRSGFAMRALAVFGLAIAAPWVAMPAAAQNIVVVLDPGTDLGHEDFDGVGGFEGDLFEVADNLADAFTILRDNSSIVEMWLVRKDECGVWDEIFPTLGGEEADAVNNLEIRGFPFDKPWLTVVEGTNNGATIEIVSTESTDILIEGITVSGGDPAVLVTTPEPDDNGNGEENGNGIEPGTVIIDRCFIRDGSNDGIEVAGFASIEVYNTVIYDNARDGIYVGPDATAELEYVSILGNAEHGLFADGDVEFEDSAVAEDEVTLTDDAYIDREFPETNFGASAELRVRAFEPGDDDIGDRVQAVLTFENPQLTGVESIQSATLRLHDTQPTNETTDVGEIRVFLTEPLTDPLVCASCITWNSAPGIVGIMDDALYDESGVAYDFDVPQAFNTVCDEFPCDIDQRFTIRIGYFRDGPATGLPPLFATSDHPDGALHPEIELVYLDENDEPVTVTLAIDTAIPGPEDEPVDCACDPDPLQEFPGDTIIEQENPDDPSGQEDAEVFELSPGTGDLLPRQRDALLQFEIAGLAPGKPVSATLTLTAMEFPADATVSVYGAANPNRPIDAGGAGAAPWDEEDVTWNDPDAPVTVRLLDTHLFEDPVDPASPVAVEFDVIRWVQGNGLISFRIESDSIDDDQFFSSKEGDDPPVLALEWQEDSDPFDPADEPPVRINNSLVWDNGDGAFFEVKPGAIQQGSAPWSEDEPENTSTMHVDDLGEIFDRDPGPTASNPRVVLDAPVCTDIVNQADFNFVGRILNEDSPLIGRGAGLPPGFNIDIDFDLRPTDGADIGADQFVSTATGAITWFFSAVTPPPGCFDQQGVAGDPVGEIAAGELRVEVRTRTQNTGVNAAPDAVFILPQDLMRLLELGPLTANFDGEAFDLIAFDGTPILPEQVIRLTPQAVTAGRTSVWIGTNTNPITTRLLAGPGNTGGFAAGDTFADGHAIVMLAYDPVRPDSPAAADFDFNVVGDQGSLNAGINTLDEEGVIMDQALIGRHVLIDTIPPRFAFEAFGPANPTADQFFAGSNDILLPDDLAPDTHPSVPPILPTSPRIAGVWPTALNVVPADAGALSDYSVIPPRAGPGGSLFFNHASISNRGSADGVPPGSFLPPADNPENALRAEIGVHYSDKTVEETFSIVHDTTTAPFNPFTGSTVRPIAGFRETLAAPFGPPGFTTTVGELLDDATDELFPLSWGYAAGSGRFDQDTLVDVRYGVNDRPALDSLGGPGEVLNFEALRAGTFDTIAFHPNAAIIGDWNFTEGGLGSIGFEEHISNSHFSARLLFRGRDAACNLTPIELDERFMGPLNLWWMINTDTRMTRHNDGDEIELGEAAFDWEVARGYSPNAVGQPQPIFAYRFYGSVDPDDINGPYEPLTDWSIWQQRRTARPAITVQEFEEIAGNNPLFFGRWLLVVALGVDEAGNVTQWPWQDLIGNPESQIEPIVARPDRPNWLRVRISREQTARASLNGQFWWKPFNQALQQRPPGGTETHRSVVPLPPPASNLAVYGKFTIDIQGIPTDFNPNNDALNVLFDLKRRGSAQALVVGNPVPGFGASIRINDPGVRRLHVFLPLAPINPGGGSVVRVFTDGGREIFNNMLFADPGPEFQWPLGDPVSDSVLGDQTRQSSVEYVARTTIWIDEGDAGGGVPEGDRAVQSRPSNFRFTVVPDTTRGRFFRPRYSPEDQPIRVREQQ